MINFAIYFIRSLVKRKTYRVLNIIALLKITLDLNFRKDIKAIL